MNITSDLLLQCEHLVPIKVLRKPHLLALLEKSELQVFKSGETILEESDKASHLFFILKGEVEISRAGREQQCLQALSHQLPILCFDADHFSAKASSDTELLVVDKERFDSLLTWSQVADYLEVEIAYRRELDADADWMQTVLNSNLFYKIPPLNIADIFVSLTSREVTKGERIIQQGVEGDRCYFIKAGSAVVLRDNGNQQSQELARIGVGRCFGEDALINKVPRNASIDMLEDGMLMVLKKEDFTRLLAPAEVASLHTETINNGKDDEGYTWLDVRSQQEFQYRHIRGSIHIPLNILRLKIRMLDHNKDYRVYCDTGSRSLAAAFLMEKKGFKVSILKNGLTDFNEQQVADLLVEGEQVFEPQRLAGVIDSQ